jgi:hypothetical protein
MIEHQSFATSFSYLWWFNKNRTLTCRYVYIQYVVKICSTLFYIATSKITFVYSRVSYDVTGSKLYVKSKGWLLYCFYCFIIAFIIVGELIYMRFITQSFYFFVVLVDLSSMIDSHVSQIMLKYHVIEISELW